MSTGDADCCASVAEAIPLLTAASVVRRIIMDFILLAGIMAAPAYSGTQASSKEKKLIATGLLE
jgi:hypothetical protein